MDQPQPAWINDEHRGIFERTRHLPGWQDPGDSAKLYELAYRHGDFILEIGVYGGRSAVAGLRGAVANPARGEPPCFLGVDLDIDAVARSYRSLAEFSLERHAAIFHGTLQDLARDVALDPSMVFLDGDHSYEGVRADLSTLREMLRPGVPILCHDYANADNGTGKLGVRRAVDEFVRAGHASFDGVHGVSALIWTAGDATAGAPPDSVRRREEFAALQRRFGLAALLRLDSLFQDVVRQRDACEARLEKLRESHLRLRESHERAKARLKTALNAGPPRRRSLWARALGALAGRGSGHPPSS